MQITWLTVMLGIGIVLVAIPAGTVAAHLILKNRDDNRESRHFWGD